MKFRYLIVDTFEGRPFGTNDKARALEFAESEDFFVVDTETSQWRQPGDSAEEIQEMQL